MKIGLWGARDDHSGLGNQTKEFYDNMKPAKTMIVDIEEISGKKRYEDTFENAKVVKYSEITTEIIDKFLDGLDIVFTIETPYCYSLYSLARQRGIKTILNYNHEYLDYYENKKLPYPDVLLNPSTWGIKKDKENFGKYARILHMPFPVNRNKCCFQHRTEPKTFIHVAGYELYEDRNGTNALINALPYIKAKNIKIIIYSQHKLNKTIKDSRVELKIGQIENYQNLYDQGDVLILPRRYGGQSLQLNEAMSCGLVPIMPNIEPQKRFLTENNLFVTNNLKRINTRRNLKIKCYEYLITDLAKAIDEMANTSEQKFAKLSKYSDMYAESISWGKLKEKYIKLFEELCTKEQFA